MQGKLTITFDNETKREILSLFDVDVEGDGYLVEAKDWGNYIFTPDGETITIDEFAGIMKEDGKLVFLKNNLPALIELSDNLQLKSKVA
jgi:hypothetical protein